MNTSLSNQLGIVITAFFILCASSLAETYHLRDGRSLEGKRISETKDSYVVEVSAGRGISNEVTIAKDDVLRIQKPLPGKDEFDELKKLTPIPDLLTAHEYTQRMQRLRLFISDHPDNDLLPDVENILKAHQDEFEVIESGGIKLNDKLLSANDRLADLYYIDSRIAESEIRKLLQTSGRLSALRAFATFETEFSGSEAWYDLLPVMQQVMASHQANARELLDGMDDRRSRRVTGLSRMAPEERQMTLRAIEQRDAALKALHDQERGIKGYWPSISPDYNLALTDTIRIADLGLRRLSTAANQPLKTPTPSQVWRNAIAAIETGDANKIKAALQATRTARMHARYTEQLQILVEEAQRQAEEAKRLAEEAKRLAEEEEEGEE